MSEIVTFGADGDILEREINTYPGGEPIITWGRDEVDGGYEEEIIAMLVRPKSMTSFMAAMFWVDAYVERGMDPPFFVLPCVPGARQDRLNPKGDYLFTIKSIARMINDRNFPQVHVLDPHSEVTPALINRCVTRMPSQSLDLVATLTQSKRYGYVVAPDAGAGKRAQLMADVLGIPVLTASKKRDVETGALSGFSLQKHDYPDSSESRVLVVDDLCDGGWTFNGLAEELTKHGFSKPDLWVTHGIFSKGTAELKKNYDQILTSDSVLNGQTDVTVFDLSLQILQGL